MSGLPSATLAIPGKVSPQSGEDEKSDNYWKNAQNTSSLAKVMPFLELNRLSARFQPLVTDIENTLLDAVNENDQKIYEWQAELEGALPACQNTHPPVPVSI